MRTNGRQPGDAILAAVAARGEIERADLAATAGLDQRRCAEALGELEAAGEVQVRDGVVALPARPPKQVSSTGKPDDDADDRERIEYRVRHVEKRTIGPSGFRRELELPSTDDSVPFKFIAAQRAALDAQYREDREAVGLPPEKRRPRQRAAKREALLEYALEHGTGEDAWLRWQRRCDEQDRPSWRFADRRGYWRAATRELTAHRRSARREMLLAMGLTEYEKIEDASGAATHKWS